MIDWLIRGRSGPPSIDVGGRAVPVAIRRLRSARRMAMRLAPDGSEVRITLPTWGRTADALSFAQAKSQWIADQLASIPAAIAIADGTPLCFRGQHLTIRHDPARPRRVRAEGTQLTVGGPAEGLEGRLRRWLEGEARKALATDLQDYCNRAGQAAPRLLLSRAQRRWGSCARDGTIRINWRLIMAPDAVRRSVVAHEVAHLLHFDHSPAFHALLGTLFEGDLAGANRWLKQHGRSLYQPFG